MSCLTPTSSAARVSDGYSVGGDVSADDAHVATYDSRTGLYGLMGNATVGFVLILVAASTQSVATYGSHVDVQ